MSTLELKKDFHNLIDSIDNENLLNNFYNLMKNQIYSSHENLLGLLTEREQKELNLAFDESENIENLVSHKSMKEKHKKWL